MLNDLPSNATSYRQCHLPLEHYGEVQWTALSMSWLICCLSGMFWPSSVPIMLVTEIRILTWPHVNVGTFV